MKYIYFLNKEEGSLVVLDAINDMKEVHRSHHSNIKYARLVACSEVSGKFFAYSTKKSVFVINIESGETHEINEMSKITSLVFSKQSDSIVTGDESGKIHTWRNISSIPVGTVAHWHSDAVKTLRFSEDEAYLLSGGKEGVVVLWH